MSIHDSRLILWYCCCVAAVLGAVMGSFLNCAAWRIAHGQNFLKGRSHCPECGHVLSVGDLVPVFSWLFLRGKCRYCGAKVSVRYLLAELFMAAVTVVCLLRYDLTVLCLRNYIFLCCLFCLSLVDLEDYTIPDGCLLVSAAVWLLALPFLHMSWKESLLHLLAALVFGGGLLLLSLAMDRILKKDTLGGGDIKLYFVVGLYPGPAVCLSPEEIRESGQRTDPLRSVHRGGCSGHAAVRRSHGALVSGSDLRSLIILRKMEL